VKWWRGKEHGKFHSQQAGRRQKCARIYWNLKTTLTRHFKNEAISSSYKLKHSYVNVVTGKPIGSSILQT